MRTADLYVAASRIARAGRGVFAARRFEPGELIEQCPVVVLPADERHLVAQTLLDNYYFDWDASLEGSGIVLGFGSIYNHSFEPNAIYVKHFELERMDIIARWTIAPDEEITINYNGTPEDQLPLRYDWAQGLEVGSAVG
jgi:uncharacterized protein